MRVVPPALLLALPSAGAQSPPSTEIASSATGLYPDGVSTRERGAARFYADARGMTLYALDQRVASGRTGMPNYGVGPCARVWTAFVAPVGAKPVGDWTIVAAPGGPQWAYRRKPVFTYNADRKPAMWGETGMRICSRRSNMSPRPQG